MRFVVLTAIALAVCACGSGDVDESTQQSFLLDPGPSGPPPVDAPELILVDITAWSGLNIPGKGDRGMSFLDADGDGVDDVALVGTDQTTILRGRGDGSFYPYWVTEHPGVTGTYPYVVDITEDGSDDIVLMAETGAHLLAGRGDGAFDYVGEIVGAPNLLAAVASYGDYNGDGRMDFYVGFQSLMGDADSLFGDPDACNFDATALLDAVSALTAD